MQKKRNIKSKDEKQRKGVTNEEHYKERDVGDRQQINIGPERNLLVQVVDEVL